MLSRLRKELPLHLMLLPGLIFVIIFSYGPMAGLVIAFQKFIPAKGIFESKWSGLDNFRFVLELPSTTRVIWNTLFIASMQVVAGLIVPIVIAILLNEVASKYLKRGIQTMVYLPHFISWAILGGIIVDVFSLEGIINRFIALSGFDPIYFLGNNTWFPFTLVITNIWKEFGFSTIVYLAALTSISPSLYEAAFMDGASRWRKIWHITLPGLRPIMVLLVTLSLGQILNAGFEQVFTLYSPQVYASGDIIDTFVYRLGLIDSQFGPATAVGLFKSVVSFVLISGSYFLAYRVTNYRIF